jgi:precorrin-6A/cobalt-precorrin-6A reductase
MTRILLLGGTTEAGLMAKAIAGAGLSGVYSYAGRTEAPMGQPIHMRVGGFGGVEGLRAYLRAECVTHVIDATHPFAAQMSANVVAACAAENVPLIALERTPWVAGDGDSWTHVADIPAAVAALAGQAKRVFLAIGRLNVEAFAAQPQHDYLLRLVDAPAEALPLPQVRVVVARGPFDLGIDTALMRDHRTEIVVAKNAGGKGAVAKIAAARALGLPVLMIDRPAVPERPVARTVAEVMAWLNQR